MRKEGGNCSLLAFLLLVVGKVLCSLLGKKYDWLLCIGTWFLGDWRFDSFV